MASEFPKESAENSNNKMCSLGIHTKICLSY